jgi:NCS1 family nucleobase:cation symporter-1
MAIRALPGWVTSPPAFASVDEGAAFDWRAHTVLAASISASLLAFLPGAYLVPALSLPEALMVAIVGALGGAALLGAVAGAAARTGQGSVGLLASTLGVRLGVAIAGLLFARHVIWTAFLLAFAANVAEHVPGLAGGRVVWGLVIAALAVGLALLPAPVFVSRWLGWFAFWVGLLIIALITLVSVFSYGVPVLHDADGLGGWPNVGQGIDIVAALPLLWLPVIADYTRRSRAPADAAAGVFAGAGALPAWYVIVGLLWVFTVNTRDVAGFMSALPLGLGGIVVVLALEADGGAANLHAASMAGGRLGYRWFRPAALVAAAAAALVFSYSDMFQAEDFLQMLSTVFVPLFAVVLVRVLVPTTLPPLSWTAWIVGVLIYGWVNPGFWEPWRDLMHWLFATVLQAPFPLSDDLTLLPASLCSAVAAAAVYLAGAGVARAAGRSA